MTDSFFDKVARVTAILESSLLLEEQWMQLQPLLQDQDVQREFWRLVKSPAWIAVLKSAGWFDHPPKAPPAKHAGASAVMWPALKYLARMASTAPREVASLFAAMETDNAAVVGDMLDAANAMPPENAVAIVPAICHGAKAGHLWLRFDDASDLCMRLIEGKHTDAAVCLAQALFTPEFDDDEDRPRGRDAYWYKKGLAKVAPALAQLDAQRFLPILCGWLETAVKAKGHVDTETGADYSYIWRPATEEHEQNHDFHLAGVMVGITRAAFEAAIRDSAIPPQDALAILDGYRLLVFRRLRMHLVAEFGDQLAELARQLMLDHALFEDHQYVHEYARLIGRRFDLLTPQQQTEWFGWIELGPEMSSFDEVIKQRLGRAATEQDRQERIQWWQYTKLHWVREHLSGELRAFYERMHDERGEPESADLAFRSGTARWGHESPMTVEQLAAMPFEEAVASIAAWQPTRSQFTEASVEGLASTFGQYVATDRVRFSSLAGALARKPAVFVRAFIRQMTAGAKAGEAVNIRPVVELCQWVISRPVDEQTVPEEEDGILVDKSWQWTRNEVAEFIEEVCKARRDSRPTYSLDGLREPMWKLLDELCRGEARSYVVHDTAEDDPRVHDYLSLGINSPRGKAVEAALEYARWVGNHVKKLNGDQEVIPGGFECMPEVREMLQWQVASGNRTFEAMSVIGSRMGLLYWIDKDWLAQHADRIFNLTGVEQTPPAAEGWAAWNAFLVWVRPHIEFYRLFVSQFAYAARQAEQAALTDREREQPMYHLGEHLVILHGRGQLYLDDDDGLLRRFIEKARPDIRRHVIGFVGTSLEGDSSIPEEVLQRFMSLWAVYWSGPGKADAKEKPDALLFGTWFGSGRFPTDWAMAQLREFVEVAPAAEPDHTIVERLAETAETNILLATQTLDRMVHGDKEGWRVSGWTKPAKTILALAMKAGGAARLEAESLINHLGRRGYTEFGKLLGRDAGT